MSLIKLLRYEHKKPNAFHRSIQTVASTRLGASLMARLLEPMDRMVSRITTGRSTAASLLAGLPVLTLTVVGARSGESRTVSLIGIPIDTRIAVIGTNFGQTSAPGWVYNLAAAKLAEITYRSNSVKVIARRATANETESIFERATALYAGYGEYRKRASHRTIKVFVLHPINEVV